MEVIRDDAARASERWVCYILLLCCIIFTVLRSRSPTGPGPGRYTLPPTVGYVNHDFTKPSSPAYSFHSRLSSASECLCRTWVCCTWAPTRCFVLTSISFLS